MSSESEELPRLEAMMSESGAGIGRWGRVFPLTPGCKRGAWSMAGAWWAGLPGRLRSEFPSLSPASSGHGNLETGLSGLYF